MIYCLISFLIMVFDFITKQLVMRYVSPGSVFASVPKILDLTYVKNTGAAFSILEGKMVFLSVLSIAFIIGVIVYVIKKRPDNPLICTAVALLFAGALGNAVDRIAYGFVVDFISVRFIDFPVFNVADMAITIGVALLIIYILFFDNKKNKKETDI